MISIADYIAYHQTGSIDWVNELRQARIEYTNELPAAQPAQPSVDPRLLRALRGQEYTQSNIQRACLRLGLPVAANIQAMRSFTIVR